MKSSNVYYNPSLIGRLGRVIIPALQRALPTAIYKVTYDLLYNSYKKTLNYSYAFNLINARLSGNKKKNLRSDLTFKLLPYTMGGYKALENAFNVIDLIEENKLDGAIIECGVAEGGTAAMLSMASLKLGMPEREKWFFDSYEGLPEPTDDDYINGKTGAFIRPLPKGSCLGTIEQVSELLFDKLNLDRQKTHLVKGWFEDTVPPKSKLIPKIAVLRLDGDWYESTKIPLENFYQNIVPGGVIIVDDYGTCFGSMKAVDEFREQLSITAPIYPDGRGGIWFQKEA